MLRRIRGTAHSAHWQDLSWLRLVGLRSSMQVLLNIGTAPLPLPLNRCYRCYRSIQLYLSLLCMMMYHSLGHGLHYHRITRKGSFQSSIASHLRNVRVSWLLAPDLRALAQWIGMGPSTGKSSTALRPSISTRSE